MFMIDLRVQLKMGICNNNNMQLTKDIYNDFYMPLSYCWYITVMYSIFLVNLWLVVSQFCIFVLMH